MESTIKIGIIGGSSGDALALAAKNMGLYSILIAGKEGERGLDIANESYIIDLKEKDRVIETLANADCVVIGTGHRYAHAIAKELFSMNVPLSIDPYKAEFGKNKLLAYQKVREFGYKVPDHQIIKSGSHISKELILSIELPCVVKSVDDSVRTAKANNIEQLKALLIENMEQNSDVLIEQFVEGVEVTIPVIADGDTVVGIRRALDMPDINRIAIDHLRYFDNLDAKYDRSKIVSDEIKDRITLMSEDIISKLELIGVPRFDIMVTLDGEIYVLEINEVAVSRFGPAHYPWELVNFNMAEEMVRVALKQLERARI